MENGKTYLVTHSRKGTFTMKVESQDDTWVSGFIVSGKAGAIMDYNVIKKGEPIKIRISLIKKSAEQPENKNPETSCEESG